MTGDPEEQGARDQRGRFGAGNKCARGNPVAKRMAALRREALESVDAGTVRQVLAKMVELALSGDVQAAKLVLAYVIGREQDRPEDAGDGYPGLPFQLKLDSSEACHDAMQTVMNALSAGVIDSLAAASTMALVESVARHLDRQSAPPDAEIMAATIRAFIQAARAQDTADGEVYGEVPGEP